MGTALYWKVTTGRLCKFKCNAARAREVGEVGEAGEASEESGGSDDEM